MANNELKKLKRSDLLEMLIAQKKENESIRAKLEDALEQLESKRIIAENAGSIAEAALQLNGVFDAAQDAASQYLENIMFLNEEQKKNYAEFEAESREKANQLIENTQKACREQELEAQKKCDEMINSALMKSGKFLDMASKQLPASYEGHEEPLEISPEEIQKELN